MCVTSATMSGTLAKIAEIESEVARTQKNKATAHLGLLEARLAKLRCELITPKGGGCGGPGEGFDVAKTGDARIGFLGFPSVGKSTLLSNLAGVYSEVAAYEFATLTTVPGVVRYKGATIQLFDLRGIIEGAKDGKGRGRQVIEVARTCNFILIVLDVVKPLGHKKIIENPPQIRFYYVKRHSTKVSDFPEVIDSFNFLLQHMIQGPKFPFFIRVGLLTERGKYEFLQTMKF
ncbi:developmentally-regulated GTP-binding protein 1-like [Leptodactylus fuscus]